MNTPQDKVRSSGQAAWSPETLGRPVTSSSESGPKSDSPGVWGTPLSATPEPQPSPVIEPEPRPVHPWTTRVFVASLVFLLFLPHLSIFTFGFAAYLLLGSLFKGYRVSRKTVWSLLASSVGMGMSLMIGVFSLLAFLVS